MKGMRIGFQFVPFPQEIWKRGIDLTQAQFKLLGYLLYQVRFGRDQVQLSDDELLNGRRDRNGNRLDGGCGIRGRNNLREARKGLEELGWIDTEETRFGRQYRVVLDHGEGSESDPPESESDCARPEKYAAASVSDRPASVSDTPNKESKKSFEEKPSENTAPVAAPIDLPPDIDLKIAEIGHLHPYNSHLGGKSIPPAHEAVIVEAIARDGYELVLAGTRNYRDAVERWPPGDRKYVMNPMRFFGSEAQYLKNPAVWERVDGNKAEQRQSANNDAISEAVERRRARRAAGAADGRAAGLF
jgi:hypothetical protein